MSQALLEVVACRSLQVVQADRNCIVHDALGNVDESCIAPEHGRE